MAKYQCSTCDYYDKTRVKDNKHRCVRCSKYVSDESICEDFTNIEYEEVRQKVSRMVYSRWFNEK